MVVTVTGLPLSYRILNLPRVKASIQREAILREIRREMPLPLEELYVLWQALGGRDGGQDFFAVGIAHHPVEAVAETLAEAGIRHAVMDLKPLALARAAQRRNALVVSLEPDYFEVVLVVDGAPVVIHSVTPRGEGATIEDNVRRLAEELSRTVRFHNDLHPDSAFDPSTPLLLAGELSDDATTMKLIQKETGYPVEPLVPSMQFPAGLPVAEYAANVGLALKGTLTKAVSSDGEVSYHDIDFDILSARSRSAASSLRLGRALTPLTLAVGAGLLFPAFQVWSQAGAEVASLEAELEQGRQELHQARMASSEAVELGDSIDELLARAAALRQQQADTITAGSGFADTLALIADALPPGASVESLAAHPDKVIVHGEADMPALVIQYATALAEAGVFSEVRIAEIQEVAVGEIGESRRTSFVIVITR